MGRSSDDEFPLLAANGLYAANIRGDGNCLFNALSDQLYGNQNEHQKIRARVIEYMREHASYYKQFVDVHAGGGIRRNPKRKNAGAYSTPISTLAPTAEEVERVFEAHLARMAKGGTYGDNMEISAFSAAFCVDVKIYQRDFAYMVSGGVGSIGGGGGGEKRQVAHIAYHVWEHYSSIRNIDGPHTGLPNVQMMPLSPVIEQNHVEKLGRQAQVIPAWMIEVAMQSLPHLADKTIVKKTLEEYNGNIDNAVSKLLDAEERGSISSARDSSSVEREPDSDEDVQLSGNGPNKKQDRRLSKATRQILKLNHRARELSETSEVVPRIDITLEENGDEKKSIGHGIIDTDEDSDWRPALSSDNTNTNNEDDTTGSEFSDISFKVQSRAAASTTSTSSRNLAVEDGPSPKKNPTSNFLQQQYRQRPQQPKKKRITARERKESKKAAQKAAAKQRKQAAAATKTSTSSPTTTAATATTTATTTNKTASLTIRMGKENTPVIAQAIKTLYI